MTKEEIISTVREKGREYKHGSDAHNAIRHLEVILPSMLESLVQKDLIAGVVFSEERAEVCQSFVVDTTTSSATICANCKKEAWEHGQT